MIIPEKGETMDWITLLVAVFVSYMAGSVPTAYLFAKSKGIDIRSVGSGNVGATNVYRSIGRGAGFFVLMIDILKGVLPVLLIPFVARPSETFMAADLYKVIIGSSTICGHIWTVFLNFRGGKGVATTTGVLIVLAPKIFLFAFLIWVIFFSFMRYVSVASIMAALSLPVGAVFFRAHFSVMIFCFVICAVGIYKHKENIVRLIKGTESKIKR